jgi:hypothetical protein
MIGMSLARDLLGARQFPHFRHFRSLVRGSQSQLLTQNLARRTARRTAQLHYQFSPKG